ncbi:lipoprotein LpqH [uncultured Tessaracoccus sp.]|uniref:lipoprotein LpqH n=1 Tax=uncultured Tessaracoccus sp. TaxID=905023 RepID=UPI0025D7621D|nr:lipoprotein LpqH [uncultured Tessaracoccus sp.]
MHARRWFGPLLLACVTLGACAGEGAPAGPSSTPVPASPAATVTSPSTTPSATAPSALPSRDATTGGALTLTVRGTATPFVDVLCDTTTGLRVVAAAGDLVGVEFVVGEDGALQSLSFGLDDGLTGLVAGGQGRATFRGDRTRFTVTGEAVTADDGSAEPVPFSLTGGCDPTPAPATSPTPTP